MNRQANLLSLVTNGGVTASIGLTIEACNSGMIQALEFDKQESPAPD